MKVITKDDISRVVAESCGVTIRDAKMCVNATLEAIASYVMSGCLIRLVGFGSFGWRVSKSRNAVDPRNGEKLVIPEKNKPTFKFSGIIANKVMYDDKINKLIKEHKKA